MKILNIVGAFPPAFVHGGPVYTTYHLSKAMIELGHEVFVLTTDICGENRLEVPTHDTEWQGVPVRYCPWIKNPIPYYSPDLPRQVRNRALTFDIALISSSWTGYGVMAGRECRQAGLPYIMYSHGSYAPMRLKKGFLKKKFWWRAFDKRLYNLAEAVVALTKTEIDEIRAMGVTVPVTHIANGVELAELAGGLSRPQLESQMPTLQGKRYILFLGRLDPIKGVDLLVSAFAKIVSDFPDVVLVIAGPDERGYRAEIDGLVQALGLGKKVLFTGMVTGSLKVGLLQTADVFVLPSLGEGMSIAVLEALACATPAVLTRACNMPEVGEVGAGLVIDRNEEQLVTALVNILADPERRACMSQQAYKLVAEQFTWKRIAEQTINLCQEVIKRPQIIT